MPVFVLLLRAVNVGGTGKLPMSDLKRLCESRIPERPHLYRQRQCGGRAEWLRSGGQGRARSRLEAYAGKPVGVIVRTAAEMSEVVALNPFPDRAANRTVAIFLDRRRPPTR